MRNYLKIPDLAPKWMQLNTLKQLTDDMNPVRMTEIEMEPMNLILSYLTNTYEIEKEFELGRSIVEQNTRIEYTPGSLFYQAGKFYKAAHLILPEVQVDAADYWTMIPAMNYNPEEEIFESPTLDEWTDYRKHEGQLYALYTYSGIVPPIEEWELIETPPYSGEANYLAGERVENKGNFYTCAKSHGAISANVIHPAYIDSTQVADTLETAPEKFDQIPDPRNGNIVRCMGILATFYMYQSNVPDRIPMTITDQEEATCKWLAACAKMNNNPLLPRKNVRDTDKKVGRAVVVASEGNRKNWRY